MESKVTRQAWRRQGKTYPQPLELVTEEIGVVEPTDVLIEVHGWALNYRDTNMLQGTNPWPILLNGIVGADAAGIVLAVGRSVTQFAVGDRASPITNQKLITGREQSREWLGGESEGVLATHIVMHEQTLVHVPEHLSWTEAAILPVAGATAWSALIIDGHLTSGKTVLVQGTGGVSLMALKLARSVGCNIIVTSSSDEKLQKIKNMTGYGSVSTINYVTTPDWDIEAIKLNGGRGVDILVENGGAASLLKSVNATASRGIVSLVGYLGTQDPSELKALVPNMIEKATNIRGINASSRLEFEDMNRTLAATKLGFDDVIDSCYKFEDVENAMARLWSGKHVGKIVIER